jgi:hypothetical protein
MNNEVQRVLCDIRVRQLIIWSVVFALKPNERERAVAGGGWDGKNELYTGGVKKVSV